MDPQAPGTKAKHMIMSVPRVTPLFCGHPTDFVKVRIHSGVSVLLKFRHHSALFGASWLTEPVPPKLAVGPGFFTHS